MVVLTILGAMAIFGWVMWFMHIVIHWITRIDSAESHLRFRIELIEKERLNIDSQIRSLRNDLEVKTSRRIK